MRHNNEQSMLMHFLNIDYSQSWEDVETEVGYAFGDYFFQKLTPQEIMPLVRMMWASLHEKKDIR